MQSLTWRTVFFVDEGSCIIAIVARIAIVVTPKLFSLPLKITLAIRS